MMFCLQLVENGLIAPLNENLNRDNSDGNFPGKLRRVMNDDGTFRVDVWLKNATGGALTKGRPYMVKFGDDKADILQVVAPATSAFNRIVVIALAATADTEFDWFAVAGWVYDVALIEGSGIAAGDPLEVINAGTSLIEDGAGGAGSQTVGTIAVALEAGEASAAAKDIFLLGREAQVASA